MTTEPAMPTLPHHLIDLIGEYGLARSDGLSEISRLHLWEQLIDGIKDYARACMQAQWQPIETAPTDGTRILLWPGAYGRVEPSIAIFNSDEYKRPRLSWRYETDHGVTLSPSAKSTHYMPLPAPPVVPQSACE